MSDASPRLPEEEVRAILERWDDIYFQKRTEQASGHNLGCLHCGARYDIDNLYICMQCGATYCYRCINRYAPVKQFLRSYLKEEWHRCACGGLIN